MRSSLAGFCGSMLVIAMAVGVPMSAQRAEGATPTFNKDVAPIIFNSCVTCHRPNQVAPMSLMSYNEVRPWARAIKDKVTKGEMPPWYADGRFGDFRNDRRLSADQVQAIVAWADGGAPQGDTPLTAQLPSVNEGWSHPSGRPPDLVIAMAHPFNVPAEGQIPNFTIYQELPPELQKEDHFVEAIQIQPGVIPVVHHSSFGIAPLRPGTKLGTGAAWPGGPLLEGALVDAKTGKSLAEAGDANKARPVDERGRRLIQRSGDFRFCCYVPGGTFRQYFPGAGQRIPKDGYISWGTHYTPIGKPVADQTRVGLWFQRDVKQEVLGAIPGPAAKHIVLGKELIDSELTPIRKRFVVGAVGVPAIPVIPPRAKDWAITSVQVFQNDMTLYTVWPHMHTRGKEMTYVLTYPDGKEQVLLSVPNYDFNWQIFYDLKEPVKVPAGSTLKLVGSYDNSPSNKWNPAPHKEVYWSEQSWDEMYAGFVDVSVDKQESSSQKSTTAGGGQ